ncbi:MAG: hypothetical protein GY754_35195 [bacterium]|nr:hypothetical protein [bacterium]
MAAIFTANPKKSTLALPDEKLIHCCNESAARFSALPLYYSGESKEIRKTSVPGLLIERLIPSLNSITEKRKGVIKNTEVLRQAISSIFLEQLHKHNIPTCYIAQKEEFLFITEEKIPPIEIIVKAAMIGTPTKIYEGLFKHKDRYGKSIIKYELHEPYIRFDYRNPLRNDTGEYLKDESMPVRLADRFINTKQAESNALAIFTIIQNTLKKIDLQVLDGCFLFDETGTVLCCEISPDNMRIKSIQWDGNKELIDDFDKDLWRKNAENRFLEEQWGVLLSKLKEL